MHCDSHMRDMFKQCHRTKFWAKAFTEEHYKSVATKAIKELVSFHSSYLSEQGFSQMIIVKNKKRNKLLLLLLLYSFISRISVIPHRFTSNVS